LSYFYATTKFDLGDVIILLTVFSSPDRLSALSLGLGELCQHNFGHNMIHAA